MGDAGLPGKEHQDGMHRPLVFPRKVILLVSLVAAAIVVLGALAHREIQAVEQPTAPSQGFLIISAAGGSGPFGIPKTFAGRVLHWTAQELYYRTGIKDPSNGSVLNSEAWELIGTDGTPSAFHVRYTYPNGELHQEMFLTQSSEMLILGKDYGRYPPYSQNPSLCVSRSSIGVQQIAGEEPFFVDTTLFAPDTHLVGNGPPSRTVPDTQTGLIPGAKRLSHFGTEATVHTWVEDKSGTRLEVGASGRLLVASTSHTGANGATDLESWSAEGPLDVYDASTVSSALYQMPQSITEGCV